MKQPRYFEDQLWRPALCIAGKMNSRCRSDRFTLENTGNRQAASSSWQSLRRVAGTRSCVLNYEERIGDGLREAESRRVPETRSDR